MRLLAALTLAFHLVWILWVIFGALGTRRRPWLTALHIAALVWGIIAELGPWPCPLTLLEAWFETRAGIQPGLQSGRGGFLVHTLDAVVYPNIPVWIIDAGAIAVCGLNLAVYLRRLMPGLRRRRVSS